MINGLWTAIVKYVDSRVQQLDVELQHRLAGITGTYNPYQAEANSAKNALQAECNMVGSAYTTTGFSVEQLLIKHKTEIANLTKQIEDLKTAFANIKWVAQVNGYAEVTSEGVLNTNNDATASPTASDPATAGVF